MDSRAEVTLEAQLHRDDRMKHCSIAPQVLARLYRNNTGECFSNLLSAHNAVIFSREASIRAGATEVKGSASSSIVDFCTTYEGTCRGRRRHRLGCGTKFFFAAPSWISSEWISTGDSCASATSSQRCALLDACHPYGCYSGSISRGNGGRYDHCLKEGTQRLIFLAAPFYQQLQECQLVRRGDTIDPKTSLDQPESEHHYIVLDCKPLSQGLLVPSRTVVLVVPPSNPHPSHPAHASSLSSPQTGN